MTTGQRDYRRRDSRRTETVGSKSDGAEAVDTDTDANGNGNGQSTDGHQMFNGQRDGRTKRRRPDRADRDDEDA